MLRPVLAPIPVLLALAVGCDTGSPEPASVRMAHFAPDVLQANFCLKQDGTATFGTPLLPAGGLAFASLATSRASVDAGTYSVRVVPGAATDCNTTLQSLGDISVALGEGGAYTLALVGQRSGSSNTVALATYVDDLSAPASPQLKLRYVHSSPELPTVDVGFLSGTAFTPLVSGISYPGIATGTYFLYNAPISGATIALQQSGTTSILLQGTPFAVNGGTVNSVFIVGRPSQGSGDQRLSFLVCTDTGVASCARFP